MPESSEKTNGSKLREEDIDSLIEFIMNEQELQPDLENMNLNNQELRPLNKLRPKLIMEGCEPVSSDSEEDNDDECNSYRWCLCKNGDKVMPSAECSYCHENYHLECFSKAKCENFKCFVCANDNDIIGMFKKEIEIRKNRKITWLSQDKDVESKNIAKNAVKADHSSTMASNELVEHSKAKKRKELKSTEQNSNVKKARTLSKSLNVSTKYNLGIQASFNESKDSSLPQHEISSKKTPSINPNFNESPTTSSEAQYSKLFSPEQTKKSKIETINALNTNKDEVSAKNAKKEDRNEEPTLNSENKTSLAPINRLQSFYIPNSNCQDEESNVLIINAEDMDLESQSSDFDIVNMNSTNHSDKENENNTTAIGEPKCSIESNKLKTIQNQLKCNPKEDALNSQILSAPLNTDNKIPTKAKIAKNEFKSDTLSSLNLADVKPKSMPLDALSNKSFIKDNIQNELNTEKLEADTSLDENQTNLNFSPVLNINSEKNKNKISSRTDEFWTGEIETQEGILSVKAVSLLNIDNYYHNKFYFSLKNCFNSSIKFIRSKQVQNTSLYPYLDKFVKTQSHYFSFLKLEPFESTEFKNTINIMGEVLNTSASEIHKTFIDKLAILNNNKSYLEMEIPEPCSHLVSSLIIFSLKAKNGEIENFFDKNFDLEIHRDVDKLMCVIVSESNKTLFNSLNTTNQATTQTLSPCTSFEREKQDDATNNETDNNQTKETNNFSESRNKRKNDSVETSSNNSKKPRLEKTNSSTFSKIHSQARSTRSSSNSNETPKSSSADQRQELGKDDKEKAKREKNIKITGLVLTDDRKEDRTAVEALFKEIDDDINKIQSIRTIERRNATPIIIVELRNKEDTISILQNKIKLKKSSKYNRVFINRDLTPDEQLIEKRGRLNSRNHRNRKSGNN